MGSFPETYNDPEFALAPKPYRIGLLLTHTNSDFGTVSVME